MPRAPTRRRASTGAIPAGLPSATPGSNVLLRYTVAPADLHAHHYRATLDIQAPAAHQEVALPVWIAGSYLVREFARHLHGLVAEQGGRPVAVVPLDSSRWRVDCKAGEPLQLQWRVSAFDTSVRAAFLDARRGFFNVTSVCLQVLGQTDAPIHLDLQRGAAPAGWKVATALPPLHIDDAGFGAYSADNYDHLADSPFELGPFWQGQFDLRGVLHQFVVAGAPTHFDGDRLLADTRRICQAAIEMWHGPRPRRSALPHAPRYVFMLNAVDDGYGGLEHRHSTALICNRRDLPRLGDPADTAQMRDGYLTLLGLVSHEYFHTWCVKRLRPAEFAPYNLQGPQHTPLLWLFEGFTSYFDDLLLARAGLIDSTAYLKLLAKTINQVLQTPGRRVQSLSAASFDAWTKYYRPDEQMPNLTQSYYSGGALVALALDLSLRQQTGHTLDDFMRALWAWRPQAPSLASAKGARFGQPISQSQVFAVLQDLAGASLARKLRTWVHSTTQQAADTSLRANLKAQGVAVIDDPAPLAQRLGLRVQENHAIQIKTVLAGSPAQAAGFSAGDEWWAVEHSGRRFRVHKLDDLAHELNLSQSQTLTAWVARDRQVLALQLHLPGPKASGAATTWRLKAQDETLVAAWLKGH
jgi:predicted metalloprotease with PDZ domain